MTLTICVESIHLGTAFHHKVLLKMPATNEEILAAVRDTASEVTAEIKSRVAELNAAFLRAQKGSPFVRKQIPVALTPLAEKLIDRQDRRAAYRRKK